MATNRPGFSKSFAPSTVQLGQRSTLTFTIDNSLNASLAISHAFADTLPAGLAVASPANLVTDCAFAAGVVATPGSSAISVGQPAAVQPAGNVCTIDVDVVATGIGQLDNLSGELTSFAGVPPIVSSGRAVAALQVNADVVQLVKEFTDDPVPAGGTATLQFRLTNFSRTDDATNIAFSDDLDATLSGLMAVSVLANTCGGMATSGFPTGNFGYAGGTLAPEASCMIELQVAVPPGAMPGDYPNTTSQVTATIAGSPDPFSAGSDTLFVSNAPALTKSFTDDPVSAGGDVTLEFTVTNTSGTSSATGISFLDELTTAIPFPIVAALPATPCGAGSTLALVGLGTDRQGLQLNNGNLAAGDSCTFSVVITLPVGMPAGTYHNETGAISATVDGTSVTGGSASDDLVVVAAPRLRKEFTNDPVSPGATVNLSFTLSNLGEGAQDATAIAFTDDLDATLSGLTAVAVLAGNTCAGSTIDITTSTSSVDFSGGSLVAGSTCSFVVTLQVPPAAVGGIYTNTTSNVSATVLGIPVASPPAVSDLVLASLTLSKQFTDDPVLPGGEVTLQFTVDNISSALDATGISFSDNLNTMLSGAVAVAPLPVTPCGVGSSITGTSVLAFSGGNLTAGTSCTFNIIVQVPLAAADGSYVNATTGMSATVGGNAVVLPGARDVLSVNSDLLLLTKSFTDDPVMPGGTVTLEFTVTNQDAANTVTSFAFTDDLDATLTGLVATGLPMAACGGTVDSIPNPATIDFSGGSLAAGASCTFSVTLQVPMAASGGDYLNTTSTITGLVGAVPVVGTAASDTLRVRVIDFSEAFDGPSAATRTAQLSFTITNVDSVNSVSNLAFSDDLDLVLSGLVAIGLPQSNVCGTGSTISGTGFLTFSGGNLPPSGSCTIVVTVQVPAGAMAGSYPNSTSALSAGGLPVAAPATANLAIEPPPTFAKAFVPTTVGVGQVSTLNFTVDNSASALGATALDFTDNLPAGLTVASAPNASTTCLGGTVTAGTGTGVISYSGGSVAAGSSCTLSVDVVASGAGAMVNTTGDLTSSNGNSGTASDTLTVIAQPGFSKAFAPASIAAGDVSTLTFTIDNSAAAIALTGLSFSDNLPAGMTVATPANASTTCTGGTLTAASASGTILYSGGSVAAASSCTVQADVTASAPGDYVNSSGALMSNIGTAGVANDTLTVVESPLFSKSFAPNSVGIGGISTLTFTIDNSATPSDATGLDFTDNFPAGMVVDTPVYAVTTCSGGTVTAVAGSSSISLSGGVAPASGSCNVEVRVLAQASGTLVNTSGDLTSSGGNSGSASAVLTVAPGGIAIDKTFAFDRVLRGGQITVNFNITNLSNFAVADGIAFSDDLDAVLPGWTAVGLPMADVCGTGSSLSGTGVISLTNGVLAASANCSFNLTLQVPVDAPLGTVTNTTSTVTANVLGESVSGAAASDDLTIVWLDFAKSFDLPGGTPQLDTDITLQFSISNPDPNNAVTGLTFTDDLDAAVPGMVAVGLPLNDVCGAGSNISGTSVITFSGGSLPAFGICTFAISVHLPADMVAGTYTNVTSPISGNAGGGVATGDPADVASASIALPGGSSLPPAIGGAELIPTLDPRWLLALVALFGLIAAVRLRQNG